jgi:leucyl aminopeptidase
VPLQENCLALKKSDVTAIELVPVSTQTLDSVLSGADTSHANWLKSVGFSAESGATAALTNNQGVIEKYLVGTGSALPAANDVWWLASIADQLPSGTFTLSDSLDPALAHNAAIGWCMAHYRFDQYKSDKTARKRTLLLSSSDALTDLLMVTNAMALVRDLVNTPTQDMGPSDLQDTAEALAERHGAIISTIVGDDLLDENLPAIHAVGRAAAIGREPRLIDMQWGDSSHPKLTLVGKGVCFDTGGLNIKGGAGMRFMKKDMGGAAHAIGLASLIMEAKLPICLRLLVPAVENAISGDAYRPGDIVATRKGLSVEIGNTDAEGRIVLCDALDLACEEKPTLLMDFATLTGAARVALGADLPATFSNNDTVWNHLEQASHQTGDPLWRLPLWTPYGEDLKSPIADLSNIAEGGMAGSITAALYLQRFVEPTIPWVHFDVFSWSNKNRPGRPVGGAAQSLRASFQAIKDFFNL